MVAKLLLKGRLGVTQKSMPDICTNISKQAQKNSKFFFQRRCKEPVCSTSTPQPCLDPPKLKWHNNQRRINEAEKYIRENTAF